VTQSDQNCYFQLSDLHATGHKMC